MSSYVITGVSRGLGFEFLRQLSSNPKNTLIGLVRDKETTEKSIESEFPGRKNIHIIQADVVDYYSLKKAADETSAITGGSLDYLINNAAYISKFSSFPGLYALAKEQKTLQEELTKLLSVNVTGVVNTFNAFLPLILEGKTKKVINLSTGHADDALTTRYDLEMAAPYAASKAAANTVIAKYAAELNKDGVLFLSLSPGIVDTGNLNDVTEEQMPMLQAMAAKFAQYAPHFTGPSTPESSVKAMLAVIDNATVEKDSGAFMSHYGDKNANWI